MIYPEEIKLGHITLNEAMWYHALMINHSLNRSFLMSDILLSIIPRPEDGDS